MKKLLKVLGVLFLVVIALGAAGFAYLKTAFPKVDPAPDLVVEKTPERIERGRYLANHVMLCMDCHAERDFSLFSGPPKPGTLGAGGDRFDQTMNFPGVFYARNITPAGIGEWTDGELYRLLTTGVNKHNEVIFPVMPYNNYAKADPEDIKDVIAYIRSLDPVQRENKPSEPAFPVSLLLNTMAATPDPQQRPSKNDLAAYGQYIANLAACNECHTQVDDKGAFIGIKYAGGRAFQFPDGTVLRSANITPHPATGIGNWTEEYFINRFKMHTDSSMLTKKVAPGEFQSLMPWMMYAGMDTTDLKAIYTYLKSLEGVDNPVVKVTPPAGK
jgi:mono/diheme cytochrome c family protein